MLVEDAVLVEGSVEGTGSMTDRWLVPVTAFRRNVGQRREEHRSGHLGELTVAGSRVPADAEVAVDVVLTSVSGGIEVSGTVRAPWEGECRRCLRPVRSELVVEVRELYRPASSSSSGSSASGSSASGSSASGSSASGRRGEEPDEETYELVGDQLDLAPLARDALLLELPLAPTCSEDCAGLCPICGADRNTEPCDCDDAPVDPRWAALDGLRAGGGPSS